MPLDKELKDGMKSESSPETMGPAETAKTAAPEGTEYPTPKQPAVEPMPTPKVTPVPVPAPAPKTTPVSVPVPAPKAAPAPRTTPAAGGQTAPVPAGMSVQFAKIERQLNGVNEELAKLMKTFETQREKPEDYTAILAKIDAAQAALEKKLADVLGRTEAESSLETLVRTLADKQEKIDRQLTQTLRDTASFQVQVRQRMQHDLDELREQQSGGQFNSILKEIASMYAEYQSVLEDEGMEPKTHRNIRALFEQMEDLLNEYDAEVCISKVGDPRPKRQCKIIKQIPTGDESKHNTIALSRKPGVMRGRLVLNHEFVDVYVYDPALKPVEEKSPAVEPSVEVEPPMEEKHPVEVEPPVEKKHPVVIEPPVEEKPPVEVEPPAEKKHPVVIEPPVEEKHPVEVEPPVEENIPVVAPPVEEEPAAEVAPTAEEEAPIADAPSEVDAAPEVTETVSTESELNGADEPMQTTETNAIPLPAHEEHAPPVRVKTEKQSFWKKSFGWK